MGSSGRLLTSADIFDGSIATADLATNAVTKRQLDYSASTDLASALALAVDTWADIGTNQSFTVDDASSIVNIWARGCVNVGQSAVGAVTFAARLVIDSGGTPITVLIGGGLGWATNEFVNVLSGSAPVALTGLSVGSHTVKLQVLARAVASAYCRTATEPTESLAIVVEELKR